MHPFSILTLGIFVAGYITARWDLVTRLYELAIFAWDHNVVVSAVVAASRWPLRSHLKLGWIYARQWISNTHYKLYLLDTNAQRIRLPVHFLLSTHRADQFPRIERGKPGELYP
jgi:phosphatidylinositol glycan class Q protein